MSDPALKRQLAEALLKIKQLEQATPKEVVKTVVEYRDREVIKEVPGPTKTVVVEKPVEKIVYVDKPYEVPVPVVEYRDREVIREVKSPPEIKIEYVDREIVVERFVEKEVVREVTQPKETVIIEKPVEKIVYVDKPYPVNIPVIEYRDQIIEKEVKQPQEIKVVYQDREVVRVETKVETEIVEKQVFVPVDVVREVVKEVYVDNPEHLKTIALLQEKLCQFTSQ